MFSTRCEFCGTSPCSCHIRQRAKCLPPCQVKCIKGPRGCRGPQGLLGPQGERGPTGPLGLTGPQGPQGPIGLQGQEGQQGPIGLQGQEGQQGPIGPQGLVGPVGPTAIGTPSSFFYATSEGTLQSGINFIGLGFESNVFSDAAIPMSCAGAFTVMVGKLTNPHDTVDLEIYKNGFGTGFILSWIRPGPMMPDPTWTEVPGVTGTYCKMSTGNMNVNVCDLVAIRSNSSGSVANAGFSLKFIG